jgi:hypothetical protein
MQPTYEEWLAAEQARRECDHARAVIGSASAEAEQRRLTGICDGQRRSARDQRSGVAELRVRLDEVRGRLDR